MRKTLLVLSLLMAFPGFSKEDFQKLTVTGNSVVYKPSDKFNLTIGVVTVNKDVKTAMSANAEKMKPIFESLKQLGLTDKEYQTGSYSINPQYTPQPKNPPPDWQEKISGYEVRNTIVIHTQKIELASDIIDTISKKGGNIIENLSFTLANEDSAKSEAIALAIQQARQYAESAAKAAGVTLGPVREITINPSMDMPRFQKTFAIREVSTPISPGDVEVSSNVQVVYELN